jgi:hypothetical protein
MLKIKLHLPLNLLVTLLKSKESLNKSLAGAAAALRDEMRERRRREWLTPFARSLTKQIACKAPVPSRLQQNRAATRERGAVSSEGRRDLFVTLLAS